MQYFDYMEDLEKFNSLMEAVDDPVVLLEADEETEAKDEPVEGEPNETSGTDKKKNKQTGALISSTITPALTGKTDQSDAIRKMMFQAAYMPNDKKPKSFYIVKKGDSGNESKLSIVNNPNSSDFYKALKTRVVLNMSALIFQCSSQAYIKSLCGITPETWQKEAESTTGGFHEAIIKALKKLSTIIASGTYGIDEQPTKKTKKKEPPKEDEPKTDEPKQDDPQPDTPTDDTDQKELFKKIIQDFKETQFDLMTADCDNVKAQTHDKDDLEYAVGDITDTYYKEVIEPYDDKATNETKEKVRTVIESNVKKQLVTSDDKGSDEKPDFDWGDKSGRNDPEPVEPTEPDNTNSDKESGDWWGNTKEAWGLNQNPLYDYKPKGKTLGQVLSERNKRTDKEKQAEETYNKQMAEYRQKHDEWEKRQKQRKQE